MRPHRGEEANQTVFVTSAWKEDDAAKLGNIPIPECVVVREKIRAFVIMSDGCEHHTYVCSNIDSISGQWSDPNQPYGKFFEPVYQSLSQMYKNGTSQEEASLLWQNFLQQGKGFENELDDKTMILGLMV
jgi:hypothetical protein